MEFVSPVLRCHMRIFQALGYCTLPPNGNLRIERFLILWSLLLMLAYNAMAYVAIFNKDSFLFANDKFGYFNDVLKFVFADLAVTTAFITSIWKRSSVDVFWKTYAELQMKSNKNKKPTMRLTWREDIWQNRRFLMIFYGAMSCEIVVMLIFICLQTFNRNLVLFWCFFTPFFMAVHLRNIQFIFYLEIIRLELLKLEQDLHLMVDYSRFHAYGTGFNGFEEFLRCKILDKQRTYQCIYEMYEQFQKSFGFSIITVMVMIYVRVLVDSYFGYYTFYRGGNKIEFVMLLPACLEIPLFLISSKKCMDVINYITLNLHCLISQFNNHDTQVTVQLQNFSLQILHQQICIDGIGISRMDGYMLVQVIGSITTYMIFFIQFMPKFSSVEANSASNALE